MFSNPVDGWKHSVSKIRELYAVKSSRRIYAKELTSDGVPFYRLADIGQMIDGILPASNLFISEERYRELSNNGQVPKTGDILVTARGTLGRCYAIADEDKFYFQDGMIAWLEQTDESPTSSFVINVFQNERFLTDLNRSCSGTTVKYLSISDLSNATIPVPPLELQQQFADFVAQVDKSKFMLDTCGGML